MTELATVTVASDATASVPPSLVPVVPTWELTKDKIAICGFASTTRHLAPYDDPTWEIWGLNEMHRHPEWFRRITRHFQMHKDWDFQKQNDKSYKEHWDWLQKQHPFPIYMLDHRDNVPSSVKYPRREVVEKLLPGVTYTDGQIIEFFTSSFAWMCALALYLGPPKEIGVWGFEMATETEFKYQRDSTAFWLGLAAGMGVKITLPVGCRLLKGSLYGYEVSRMFNRQRIEMLLNHKKARLSQANQRFNRINGSRTEIEKLVVEAKNEEDKMAYRLRAKGILEQEIEALGKASEFAGQVGLLETMIKELDAMGTVIPIDPDYDRKSADAILESQMGDGHEPISADMAMAGMNGHENVS